MPEISPEARKAMELIAWRKANERFRYYEPNGKCEQLIRSVVSGGNFITAFFAANGVGKTAVGVNLLAHLIYTPHSDWFRGGVFDNWQFPKVGRIISDPTTVQRTLIPEIVKWFPMKQYFPTNGTKHYLSQWKIPHKGWEFDIMTYDQDPKEFESSTLGFVWFDEPPPLAIFKATVARMRMGGLIVLTNTPLIGSAWMYDEIFCKPIPGQRVFFEAEIEDNCQEHGVRGKLAHKDIENMVAQYTEDEKHARIKGKFHHLTGLIFKKFSRKIHIIKPLTPDMLQNLVCLEALDPHPRNPDALMWAGKDAKGNTYVIDEWYSKGTVHEVASIIHTKSAKYRLVRRIADPSIFVKDQHTDISLADRFEQLGIEYEPASKERAMAIRATEDALDYQMRGDEFLKKPMLYICSNCERTIWEFEHWQWDDWRGRTIERKDPREAPVDKDDHMMENLGRILLEEVDWKEEIRGKSWIAETLETEHVMQGREKSFV